MVSKKTQSAAKNDEVPILTIEWDDLLPVVKKECCPTSRIFLEEDTNFLPIGIHEHLIISKRSEPPMMSPIKNLNFQLVLPILLT